MKRRSSPDGGKTNKRRGSRFSFVSTSSAPPLVEDSSYHSKSKNKTKSSSGSSRNPNKKKKKRLSVFGGSGIKKHKNQPTIEEENSDVSEEEEEEGLEDVKLDSSSSEEEEEEEQQQFGEYIVGPRKKKETKKRVSFFGIGKNKDETEEREPEMVPLPKPVPKVRTGGTSPSIPSRRVSVMQLPLPKIAEEEEDEMEEGVEKHADEEEKKKKVAGVVSSHPISNQEKTATTKDPINSKTVKQRHGRSSTPSISLEGRKPVEGGGVSTTTPPTTSPPTVVSKKGAAGSKSNPDTAPTAPAVESEKPKKPLQDERSNVPGKKKKAASINGSSDRGSTPAPRRASAPQAKPTPTVVSKKGAGSKSNPDAPQAAAPAVESEKPKKPQDEKRSNLPGKKKPASINGSSDRGSPTTPRRASAPQAKPTRNKPQPSTKRRASAFNPSPNTFTCAPDGKVHVHNKSPPTTPASSLPSNGNKTTSFPDKSKQPQTRTQATKDQPNKPQTQRRRSSLEGRNPVEKFTSPLADIGPAGSSNNIAVDPYGNPISMDNNNSALNRCTRKDNEVRASLRDSTTTPTASQHKSTNNSSIPQPSKRRASAYDPSPNTFTCSPDGKVHFQEKTPAKTPANQPNKSNRDMERRASLRDKGVKANSKPKPVRRRASAYDPSPNTFTCAPDGNVHVQEKAPPTTPASSQPNNGKKTTRIPDKSKQPQTRTQVTKDEEPNNPQTHRRSSLEGRNPVEKLTSPLIEANNKSQLQQSSLEGRNPVEKTVSPLIDISADGSTIAIDPYGNPIPMKDNSPLKRFTRQENERRASLRDSGVKANSKVQPTKRRASAYDPSPNTFACSPDGKVHLQEKTPPTTPANQPNKSNGDKERRASLRDTGVKANSKPKPTKRRSSAYDPSPNTFTCSPDGKVHSQEKKTPPTTPANQPSKSKKNSIPNKTKRPHMKLHEYYENTQGKDNTNKSQRRRSSLEGRNPVDFAGPAEDLTETTMDLSDNYSACDPYGNPLDRSLDDSSALKSSIRRSNERRNSLRDMDVPCDPYGVPLSLKSKDTRRSSNGTTNKQPRSSQKFARQEKQPKEKKRFSFFGRKRQ